MTKRQPVRYAHPLDVPEGQAWYVPGQVGEMVNAPVPKGQPRPKKPKKIPHPTQGYEPGGLRIGGKFYLGGEALSHHDLQELAEAGILDEVLPYLHSDRESALNDYSGERAAPGKDELARRAGRDLAPGEQLPRPERRQVSGKPLGANKRPATPDEGLSNLPGGVSRWKGIVSDEEAANLSPAQAEKFVDLWNELPASDDYAAGARLGLAKRGWYEDAAKTIVAMFGDDAPRFTALLAATSPVKSVQQNLQNALITWDLYAQKRAALGREMSKGEMRQWLAGDYLAEVRDAGGYSISGEDGNITRALLKGEVGQPGTLSGPKVDSFARNLLGKLHAVTNDTWMAAFGGVQQKRLSGVNRPDEFGPTRDVYGGGYAAAAAKAREAAQILNQRLGEGEEPWQPGNVQETTWSVQRSLGDTMGGSRYLQRTAGRGRPLDLRARDIPDPDQTVYGLTNAKVHGNADFATLLAEALDDEGDPTGQALHRLFERHPEMAKAYDLREKENRKVQAGRISQLPPRAMQNLLPGQLPAALRVGRRAGESSGRFDNSVVQESRRGQKRPSLRHRRVEKYSDAMVASSNNTEENLSFDEAFARVQSGDQKVFKDIADQMTKSMGLQGTSYSAIGDWEDGAEHSLLTQIPGQADMDTLRYVGAWQGLTGNQRSVLVFRPDHGGHDSVYQIQVPETDAAKVRAQLSKFGVPFRTIIPGKQGTKVVIYDQKRQLRDNVTQFAGMYNAPVRESIGSGEYVGGSSRSEARAAYRKVIADYEAKTGRRPQGAGPSPGPQAGGPVHPQQAGQPRGRRGTQGAEAAQGRGGRGA